MNGTRPAANPRDLFDDPARFDAAFDRAFTLVAVAMDRHLVDHMLRRRCLRFRRRLPRARRRAQRGLSAELRDTGAGPVTR